MNDLFRVVLVNSTGCEIHTETGEIPEGTTDESVVVKRVIQQLVDCCDFCVGDSIRIEYL